MNFSIAEIWADTGWLNRGIVILLILVLFVLRPLIRNLSLPKLTAAQLEAPAASAGAQAAAPAMAYEQQVAPWSARIRPAWRRS